MKNMAYLDKVDMPNDNQKRTLWLILLQLVPVGYVRNMEANQEEPILLK
jgi:hypothetical protein